MGITKLRSSLEHAVLEPLTNENSLYPWEEGDRVGDYGPTEATRGWGHPIGVLTRHSGSVRVQTRGLSERVTLCVRAWLTNRGACV